MTATLGKIRGDAIKIKKHFDIKALIFATAEPVTNTTAESWSEDIREEFNYELIVMPREDVITLLQNPTDLALCRTHLGIPVTLEQTLEAKHDYGGVGMPERLPLSAT